MAFNGKKKLFRINQYLAFAGCRGKMDLAKGASIYDFQGGGQTIPQMWGQTEHRFCRQRADILILKHASRILRQDSNPVCGSRKSQANSGQTAQRLACSIIEKPHTGLDDCQRILLSCFIIRMSDRGGEGSELQNICGRHIWKTPNALFLAYASPRLVLLWGK